MRVNALMLLARLWCARSARRDALPLRLLPYADNLMSRFEERSCRRRRVRRCKPRRLSEWEDDHECDWETGQPLDDDAVNSD
jgi:hypothetical protein